jgi:hypothetical protein
MADQAEEDRLQAFIKAVRKIGFDRKQGVKLLEFWPREIADAIQALIDIEVRHEREACALLAEAAAESSGAFAPGQTFAQDPGRREICLDVAASIRARR